MSRGIGHCGCTLRKAPVAISDVLPSIDTRRHKPTHPTVLVALLLPLPQACELVRARGSPARTWGSAPLFLTMLYLMVLATYGQSAQAESAAPLPGKVYRVGYSQFVDHPAL
jgi:hypothetical protein